VELTSRVPGTCSDEATSTSRLESLFYPQYKHLSVGVNRFRRPHPYGFAVFPWNQDTWAM